MTRFNFLPFIALMFMATMSASCAQVAAPVSAPSQPQVEPAPTALTENATGPAPKFDPGGKPDRSYVKISDRIGSRDPNSPDCEYYIKVQNLHNRWSLKNVAVDINGTVYLIAATIGPGESVEFYRPSLPRPETSYHVFYDWQAPE